MSKHPAPQIIAALNVRKNRILDLAQMAMNEFQFTAFRRQLLSELGEKGFQGELDALLRQQGMDRNGDGRE
jgi:hypothetical protein